MNRVCIDLTSQYPVCYGIAGDYSGIKSAVCGLLGKCRYIWESCAAENMSWFDYPYHRSVASMLNQTFFRLADMIPPPESRKALTAGSFLVDILPLSLSFYGTAVLALIPGTFHVRLALLPFTLWSAFNAATTIDITKSYNEPRLAYLNQGFCVCDSISNTLCLNIYMYYR